MNNRYPYLPEGREIKYVSISVPYMLQTKTFALENSTDSKQPTGAIVVKDGKVIGRGANQSILRNRFLLNLHNKLCIRKMLRVKSGTKYWMCPGCASSDMHSEVRAINDAIGNGFDTRGADLYHWGHWWCCKPCWDMMIKSGIKDVYLVDDAEELFKKLK
jgi:deoxycytidylate deaminase